MSTCDILLDKQLPTIRYTAVKYSKTSEIIINGTVTCMMNRKNPTVITVKSRGVHREREVPFPIFPVASLRLVSPDAVTDGVTFFTSKSDDLFSHLRRKSLLFGSIACTVATRTLSAFPADGLSSILCKFSRKIYTFIRVPPFMVSCGAFCPQ